MYWDYPEVSTRDRLDHAPPIDASRVRLSPEQAYAALKRDTPPASVRLFMFDGRPAYRFDDALVFADDGHVQDGFPLDLTLRIASSWAEEPTDSAAREIVTRPDQWTVSGEFRGLRPLDKYSWPDGQRDLRLAAHGRSGAIDNASLAAGLVLRSDSALAVLHSSARERPAVESNRPVGVGRRRGDVAARIDRRNLDHGSRGAHSLHRPEALARALGPHLRSLRLHLGLQRLPFDGAFPIQRRPARDGIENRRRARRRRLFVCCLRGEASAGGADGGGEAARLHVRRG